MGRGPATWSNIIFVDAKNNLLAVGAALLPAALMHATCDELNTEFQENDWQQASPAQHHTADQDPSDAPAVADDSGPTISAIPPILINIPSVPIALEDSSGNILLEDGSGYLVTEPRHLVATPAA
jgi:hypothetical protein